ncbi:MAG: protein kinase domain-containing protein [Vicinamibacterales bacterium]
MPLASGIHIVGRFEIIATLGAGSMGEVYQAHDLKLRRDVALKLLSSALATSEEHLLRFERESRAASALNHPHICTIYDVGQAPEADDRPYLVMELLRGSTLYEMMASGPVPVATVVNLGVQVADALDAAHGAGIIHRDLKPANIFVTTRGDAKLLDFGLAAMVARAADASSSGEQPGGPLTSLGTAVGTVLYMSPEQALGDPLDPRTDVFSLGLVLYEMLTGRRAFEGRSTTAIVDAILHASPAGLDLADVSGVPRELRRLIGRMLEKERDKRPASSAEVAARLRAVQSGSMAGREYAATASGSSFESAAAHTGPGPHHHEGPAYRAAASSSGLTTALAPGKLKDVVTVALLLALLTIGGYGAYTWYRGAAAPPPPREPLLLADFSNTTGEAVFDGALKDALEIQLQQSPYVKVLPTSQVRSALQLMQRSPTEPLTAAVASDLCERLGVKAILLGSIAPLSSAYVITLEAQACRTGDTLARDQAQASVKTDVLATVGAAAARIRERLGESIGSIQKFNVPAPNATTPSLDALKAYSLGIETRLTKGDIQAIPFFEQALELDPNFALAAVRLGAIYTNLQDLDRAQHYTKQAFARSESLSEPERLFIRSHYHYIVTGRLDEAVATYRMWIGTYPDDWVPHTNLSTTYARLNQYDSAIDEARAGVRLAPNLVIPYQQLTRALMAVDRLSEAKQVVREVESKGLDSTAMRQLVFDLAFIDGDSDTMQAQLRAASSRLDGYLVLTEGARAAMASGDLEGGRNLYARAVAGARAARINDFAGRLLAEQGLIDALMGEADRAHTQLRMALAAPSGPETTWTASLAAAFSNRVAQAGDLAKAFQAMQPPAPDVVNAQVPELIAAIANANNDPATALSALNGATQFEATGGPWVSYLRGLAYSAAHDPAQAVRQFRTVIEHPGNEPTNFVHSLAHLQLGRAARNAGDLTQARQAYVAFNRAWRNARPDDPLLTLAAREAAALPASSTTAAPR